MCKLCSIICQLMTIVHGQSVLYPMVIISLKTLNLTCLVGHWPLSCPFNITHYDNKSCLPFTKTGKHVYKFESKFMKIKVTPMGIS